MSHAHSHPDPGPSDTIGTVLSAVCAVHCVTTPIFMTLAPAAASVFGGAHPVLLVLVVLVGLWAFVPGYRCHQSKKVVGLAVLGVSLLAIAAFLLAGNLVAETSVSIVGAGVMMFAHWQNRKLLREAHAH
jgi:hypothetical protein